MKRIKADLHFLLLPCILFFSGCATIVSKSSYPVYLRTDPPGANIKITDKKGHVVYQGKSPTTVRLKSGGGYFTKAQYQVKLSSAGYDEKIVTIDFKLNGWYFGNLVIGGVIGLLFIDPITGAMWKIQDPVVDETLDRMATASAQAPELNIVNIADVSPEQKSKLIRIN